MSNAISVGGPSARFSVHSYSGNAQLTSTTSTQGRSVDPAPDAVSVSSDEIIFDSLYKI